MEDYSIRIKQLNDYKLKVFVIYFFFLILAIVLEIGIYHLLTNVFFKYENQELYNIYHFLNAVIYFFIMSIVLFILFSIYGVIENIKYRRYYLQILFQEAKLDEIYLLENKPNESEERKQYLTKLFCFNDISYDNSFSDASNRYSIDVNTIKYKKDNKNHVGTLFIFDFYVEQRGFLKLTKDTSIPFEKYNGVRIDTYGFNNKSLLKEYNMFSTYSDKSYLIEDMRFQKSFIELERFIKKDLNFVIDNESIYIFVDNFKFFFVDDIFIPVTNNIFSDKMKAIRRFHDVTFNIIKVIDELFVNK